MLFRSIPRRCDSQSRRTHASNLPHDVFEILSIPLLGVIPESEEVLRASNLGAPITICGQQSAPAHAYMDAARRLNGEEIEMLIPTEKIGFFTKIFGRRAA